MQKRLFTLLMGVEVEKERRTIRVLGCRSLPATHCPHCEERRRNKREAVWSRAWQTVGT